MQFEEQISYSYGKPYYIDTITGETQWGSEYFFNTNIPLPKGYICLILNGKDVYKYIGEDEDEDEDLNSYAPDASEEDKPIISATYKELQTLKTQPAINEMFRRLNLFENVSKLLKRIPESIIDESLKYLASKADVLPKTIIDYIQTTEREELGENAILTPFYRISQTDSSFSSERSIRELCGLNMQEEELSSALKQLKELTCAISLDLIHDPVMTGCVNGHTCDKSSMEEVLKTSVKCPICRGLIIRTSVVPNVFANNILDEFTNKYVHQRGEIWKKIKEMCIDRLERKKSDLPSIEERERLLIEQRRRTAEAARIAREEIDRLRIETRQEIQEREERDFLGRQLRAREERDRLEREERDRLARERLPGGYRLARQRDRLAREERDRLVAGERDLLVSEQARIAREEAARVAEQRDRLQREQAAREEIAARIARDEERARVAEAARIAREEADRVAEAARIAREQERVRVERERERLAREETARLQGQIEQGNFYRERDPAERRRRRR
jgi:hypothetical protein